MLSDCEANRQLGESTAWFISFIRLQSDPIIPGSAPESYARFDGTTCLNHTQSIASHLRRFDDFWHYFSQFR